MFVAVSRIVLDYFGNDDLKEKKQQVQKFLKNLRRDFNISCSEVAEFGDIERCVVGLSLTAATEENAREAMRRLLEHIDQTAFTRVMVEQSDFFSYEGERFEIA